VREGVKRLRENLVCQPLPDKIRDGVERVVAWSPDAVSEGATNRSRAFVSAASEDLVEALARWPQPPFAKEAACRAIRVADLVREASACAIPGAPP